MRTRPYELFLSLLLALGCSQGYGDPSDAGPIDGPTGKVTFSTRASLVAGQPATFEVNGCFWSGPAASGPAMPGDGGRAFPCVGDRLAGCCIEPSDPGLDDTGCAEANLDVGPVQLSVNQRPVATLRFVQGSYLPPASAKPMSWNAGDRLEASGGGVKGFPAFDVIVTAVAPVNLTAPPSLLGVPLTLDRAQALALGWSPPSAAASEAWIAVTNAATGQLMSVDCQQAPDLGTRILPATALLRLPAGGLGVAQILHSNRTTQGSFVAESRAAQQLAVETP